MSINKLVAKGAGKAPMLVTKGYGRLMIWSKTEVIRKTSKITRNRGFVSNVDRI